jgi:hypothetical protein
MGYTPPLLFFDLPAELDPFEDSEYALRSAYAEFMRKSEYDALVAKLSVQDPSLAHTFPAHGTQFARILYDDDGIEIDRLDREDGEWEHEEFERHYYARLWLERVGRKERARRVARVIVHSLFGTRGLGCAHLVCDMIADFVVLE